MWLGNKVGATFFVDVFVQFYCLNVMTIDEFIDTSSSDHFFY